MQIMFPSMRAETGKQLKTFIIKPKPINTASIHGFPLKGRLYLDTLSCKPVVSIST